MALDDTLHRLKQERDEADRRYNDALTALDRAMPAPPEWPAPPQGLDDSQLPRLNDSWNTLAEPAAGTGWRGRLAGVIWRIVAPSLQRQLNFNAAVVDHLNRDAVTARAVQQHAHDSSTRLRGELARLAEFHSRLIQYLQQVTAFIDTRDRDSAGAALVLNASLSGLAESVDKRWESWSIRDQRADARAAALSAGQDELRALLSVSQQATLTMKRELERILSAQPAAVGHDHHQPVPAHTETFRPLDSYKYVGFEDQFRGSRDEIRTRLDSYVPGFAGAHDILDVGCGRGEFLELLAQVGVRARGIDLNHEMVELCRSHGLDVTEADAVGYLSSLPDGSLGGLFAAQVVEHLQPAYLLQFLELAFHKLRPGSRIVLETLNPACWVAFFDSYIRDITHAWPLHPDTLKYLVVASGFSRADIEFRSPVPPEDRLQTLSPPARPDAAMSDFVEIFNGNMARLNARIFTHRDYAVIGAR
jgi:SAM-dependent methyltransferase